MEINLEELVSDAKDLLKKMRELKISSDKVCCTTEQIMAFLKNGATPIDINQELIEGEAYLHTVSYENITFVNVTEKPVQELGEYLKNK